jgi:hypothetical protein
MAAKFLSINERKFNFVRESGVAQKDYDIDLIYGDKSVACEVKCRLEDSTIESVRKHLPGIA